MNRQGYNLCAHYLLITKNKKIKKFDSVIDFYFFFFPFYLSSVWTIILNSCGLVWVKNSNS